MEVIKHGNTYKEVECQKCGALLSYCKADVKEINKDEETFYGDWHYYIEEYITCPECDKRIILYKNVDGEVTLN